MGFLLLLAAITIVLSLTPIYLPRYGSTLHYVQHRRRFNTIKLYIYSNVFLIESQLFYIEYRTIVDNETINYLEFVTNLTTATEQV